MGKRARRWWRLGHKYHHNDDAAADEGGNDGDKISVNRIFTKQVNTNTGPY